MTAPESAMTLPSDREIVQTFVLDAPRELVWRAYTEPEMIPQWWGPRYLTTTIDKLEMRPGGAWRFVQRDADGNEYGFHGEIREITPLERIVQTFIYEGTPDQVVLETATFEDLGGKTKVTTHSLFDSRADRDGMIQEGMEEGARESIERLGELMAVLRQSHPAGRELVIERIFDAPRELVWRAWTEPEHFTRWWGPKDYTAPVAKIDLRVGGKMLNSMRSPEGQEYWSTGVYREIVPPERLVLTDSFADPEGHIVPASYYGMPGEWPLELLVTITLEEQPDGRTKLTLRHSGFPAGEPGDMAEAGWIESLDKLASVLAGAS